MVKTHCEFVNMHKYCMQPCASLMSGGSVLFLFFLSHHLTVIVQSHRPQDDTTLCVVHHVAQRQDKINDVQLNDVSKW